MLCCIFCNELYYFNNQKKRFYACKLFSLVHRLIQTFIKFVIALLLKLLLKIIAVGKFQELHWLYLLVRLINVFCPHSHGDLEGLDVLITLGCGQITMLGLIERDSWKSCWNCSVPVCGDTVLEIDRLLYHSPHP